MAKTPSVVYGDIMQLNTGLKAMAFGLGAIGPGLGIGLIFGFGVLAMARQPEMSNAIRQNMLLGLAFTESLALIGLVLYFMP